MFCKKVTSFYVLALCIVCFPPLATAQQGHIMLPIGVEFDLAKSWAIHTISENQRVEKDINRGELLFNASKFTPLKNFNIMLVKTERATKNHQKLLNNQEILEQAQQTLFPPLKDSYIKAGYTQVTFTPLAVKPLGGQTASYAGITAKNNEGLVLYIYYYTLMQEGYILGITLSSELQNDPELSKIIQSIKMK